MKDINIDKIKIFFEEHKNYILIVICVLLACGIGWYLYNNKYLLGGKELVGSDSLISDINNLNEKAQLTLYYSDECSACNIVKPIWLESKKTLNGINIQNNIIDMIEVNGQDNMDELIKNDIEVYPTITLNVKDKKIVYDGSDYDHYNLETFINSNL